MSNKSERKILSFSTTMRNPYRIGKFLVILSRYEKQILTHNVIMNIVKDILQDKLYTPNYIKHHPILINYINNDDIFTDQQLDDIISNSNQNHKEYGFEKGWESRFDTWYKLMSEFGFCYYAKGEKILISDSAKILINNIYDKDNNSYKLEYDESIVGRVFLNALAKYEVGNPYKKNLNHNTPFRLLIKLLLKLKKDNYSPISIKEIPILLCWHNNDVEELYEYIKYIRDENHKITGIHNGYSPEYIYEKCLQLLNSNNTKRFKLKQITSEAVDEYIRKMRITGLISLRGHGNYIDINKLEMDTILYIAGLNSYFPENYQDSSDENKLKFYNYMAQIDPVLISTSIVSVDNNIKVNKLKELANFYHIKYIQEELEITCNKSKISKDELFKIIDKPLRLEFLTALYLTKHFKDTYIIPNYKTDDEGYPIYTASGGKADIIVYDNTTESYIEVSLLRDRTQTTNEMIPIRRHLKDYIANTTNNKNKFSVFIAPIIHDDAKVFAKFTKYKDNLNIFYYSMEDFIRKINTIQKIEELHDEKLLTMNN